MSDDKDDLELQALQRQLDDAFETTRPRRGFEDELWLRLQARRPFWTRLRDASRGLMGAIREAPPAIPLAAVAVLLIVVVGAGILATSGLRLGGGTLATSQGRAPNAADLGQFGRLPSPALHPGLVDSSGPASIAFAGPNYPPAPVAGLPAPSNIYFGPATLSWAGQFPSAAADAPVLRYAEPGVPLADQFAASLGASTSKQVRQVNGFLGTYAGQDFIVSVRGSVPQLPREPVFTLRPTNPAGAQGTDPQEVATAFLAKYSLLPTWPDSVGVLKSGDQARVQFVRAFQVPGGGLAYLVDWNGERYGIEVDLIAGRPVAAGGPLPLNLDSATYPLISNAQAAQAAVSSAPASTAAIHPTPVVKLDAVQLVYALAVSGGEGYYEPAYLFSGSFVYNGQTYVKRVLVPLVEPGLRSS